jgi:hypothetical protein
MTVHHHQVRSRIRTSSRALLLGEIDEKLESADDFFLAAEVVS